MVAHHTLDAEDGLRGGAGPCASGLVALLIAVVTILASACVVWGADAHALDVPAEAASDDPHPENGSCDTGTPRAELPAPYGGPQATDPHGGPSPERAPLTTVERPGPTGARPPLFLLHASLLI